MNEYKEYLNVAVLQENKPVTYKALARSLGIHVNTAKQALFEFSSENDNNVYIIYCITGVLTANDLFTIKLVKASEVEETKRSYKQITGIHVYSVTPVDTNDFSLLYTACKDFPKLSLEDRIKSGILKNANVTFKDLQSSRPVEVKKPITPPVSRPAPAKPATPTKNSVKRKGTLSFGPSTTKKQAIETPQAVDKVQSKPVSNIFNQSNRKKDDEDIEMRMAKATIKPDDIFSDDEDEEEKDDIQPEALQEPEDLRIDDDDDETMEEVEPVKKQETKEEETKEENHVTSSTSSETSSTPGKAMKKVLRKKTTKNARGFLVTEEVWEMEEVDVSELPKPKPTPFIQTKPKPTNNGKTASKKNGSNSKSGAQTDLFSFFKKK
ncbi:DNA polymerase subunit Cdc27-domain-containing protein, partial [Pilaira anomala]